MSISKINRIFIKMTKIHRQLPFHSQLLKYLILAIGTEEKIKKKRNWKDHNHLINNLKDPNQLQVQRQLQMQKELNQ